MEALKPFNNVAVLCDLDGSLVHTPVHKPCGSLAAREIAVKEFNGTRPDQRPLDPHRFWSDLELHTTDDDRLDHNFSGLTWRERLEIMRIAGRVFVNDSIPLPGATDGLKTIVKQGAHCYLWTGNPDGIESIARKKADRFIKAGLIDSQLVFGADFPIQSVEPDFSDETLVTKHILLSMASRLLTESRIVIFDDALSGWQAFDSAPDGDIQLSYRLTNQVKGILFGHKFGECDMIGDPLFRLLALDIPLEFIWLTSQQQARFLNWLDGYIPPKKPSRKILRHFNDNVLDIIAFQIFDSAYWPINVQNRLERMLALNSYKIRILSGISNMYLEGSNWMISHRTLPLVDSYFNYYASLR